MKALTREEIATSEEFRGLPRKRVGAGVVVVDASRRVLLVQPTYKEHWEVPGGLVEAGESPRDAASREVREELGLDLTIGRLLIVDWVAPGWLPDDALMFLYAVGAVDTDLIRLPPDELASWEWCAQADLENRLPEHMVRRVLAAIAAVETGTMIEAENGDAVDQPTGHA